MVNKGYDIDFMECKTVIELLHVPIVRLEIDVLTCEDEDQMNIMYFDRNSLYGLSNNPIKIRPLIEEENFHILFFEDIVDVCRLCTSKYQ